MFQVELTAYGQTLISSVVIIDGVILLLDYIDDIYNLDDYSGYTLVLNEEACGNLKGSIGNIRLQDFSGSEYSARTILFYKKINNENKIIGGYSQENVLVQKSSQNLNLFLSLDLSAFTGGFLFSSIQAGFSTASHNTDGLVHIENPDISSDDTYSVYSKPQVDELLKNKDTELIRGTQTVSTASWTGNTVRNRLYEGMCINYFLPFAGKASSTLQLTLSNGTITDAIPIYFRGATAVGTHFPVGSVIQLTYMENVVIGSTTIDKGWFADSDYLDGNTTTYISTAQPLKAGTNGIYGRCLVMRTGVDTWESIMLSYSNKVASYVLNTSGFYPDVIFYTSGTTKVNSGSNTTATHYNIYNNLSYTNYFADVTTNPLVIGKPFYFVGTFHDDGKFYFNNPNYHAQEVTTGDIYVLVGLAYSTTTISLLPDHPMYTLKDGVVTQITHQSFVNSEKIDGLEDSIPTNTSDLINDSGFITSASIPTDVSAFNNDAGYLTSELDPTVPSWAKQPTKPSYTAAEVHALPDTTVIPTVNDTTITIKKNISDTGDSFTTNTDIEKTINLNLSTVATSGSYNDLSNKPNIPTVNDTTITIKKNTSDTGDSFTTNTDTEKIINLNLSIVATSGSYNDLSNKPSIPVNTSDLINDSGYLIEETDPTVPSWAKQPTKPTYTANEVGALPSNTFIPANTSELTNDAGFITSSDIPTDVSAFNNDAGYLTSFTETDPTVPSWAKQSTKPSYTLDEVQDGSTRKLSNYVPTTRKVNNKALSSDITLNLDDVLDGSTRKLNNYVPYSEVISTINGFDNRRLWQYEVHNTLWAAEKRYDITLTGFSNNNAKGTFFDGSFETNLTISQGNTGVILIAGKNNTKMWGGGYPYGYLEVAFYYTNIPESVTCRVYSDWAQNPGWHDITLTNVCKNNNQALFRGTNTGFYGVTQMEITVVAKSNVDAKVTEVAFYQTRGTLQQMSIFNKTVAQTLYHDLTGTKFIVSGGTSSQFLKADGSLDSNTYITSASIPTNVSAFNNDAGYIASSALTPYELKTNLKEGAYVNVDETTMTSTSTNLPTGKAVASYISGLNYATVSQVPTNVSQLNNDSGYLTDEDLPDFELKANLKDGAYKDVNTSITSSTKTSTNLATVNAITSYIEPLIPTKTSEITNDSGYITNSDIPTNVSAFNNDAGYLTSHQSLAGVVASAQYNATTKKIEFYNSSSTKLNTDIDASAFIKDGMIDTVEISNGKLVISFNTDAGKEDIEIPISDIFDASNYYTKTETNTQISSAITNLNLGTASTKNYSTDMNTDANLPTTSAIKSYISDQGFALASSVPTKTSELNNDSGFITSSSLDDYVLKVSSTDNAVTRFNGTSGEVQNSNVIIDDSNNLILPIATSTTFSNNAKLVLGNAWFGSNPTGGLAYGTRSGSTYTGKYTFESTTFRPVSSEDNKIDIGTSSYRWKDLYIAGKICKNSSYQITVPSKTGTMALTSDIITDTANLTNGAGFITSADIPTKTSELTNDSGYITISSVPKKTSELTNDAGFITSSDIPTDVSDFNNDAGYITISSVPTKTSELNNDSGYITSSDLTPYELKTNLKEGAYVNVDETTTTSSSTNLVTGKSMSAYVSSVLPTVNNATLTIQKNGTTVNTFTANASSPVTANITVPTTVAELNDVDNYVTQDDLEDAIDNAVNSKQNIIVAGDNVTITSQSQQLPDTFAQVEYIQSNGQSYINTNIAPTDTMKMIVDVYSNSNGSFYLAGARTNSSSTILYGQSGSSTGSTLIGSVNGTGTTASTNGTNWSRSTSGQRYLISLETSNGIYYYNIIDKTNDREFTSSKSYTLLGTQTTKIWLCAFNTSNILTGTTRIYRFELYDNEIPVFIGIPCYRISDGKYGLYDTVSNTFFPSNSSTEFTGSTIITDTTVISAKDEKAQWGKITGTLSNQTDLNNALNLKANSADLSDVATSGSYNDLSNKPNIPTVNNSTITIKKNNSDTGDSFTTNASSGKTINLGLSTVATSGSYNDLSNKPSIPSKTSELTNDSDFITSDDVPTKTSELNNDSGFITSASIPTNVSAFNNDVGYLTSFTETDPTVPSWAKQSTKPSYTASEVGALPDTTVIPTKTTARSDGKYLYNGQSVDVLMDNIGFSNANNLINTSGVTAYVTIRANSNNPFLGLKEGSNLWYAQAASNYFYFGPTSAKALRLDQSGNGTFQTGTCTATGFKYKNGTTEGRSDQFLKADGSLDSNTYLTSFTETDPTVPSWAKQSTKPTYTASEIGALPDSTIIPSKTSELTNDSGFLTEHQDISGKQDLLTAGEGIALSNNTIKTTGIPFGICDSTSTATAFTVTVPGIYKLEDGVCCMVKNGVVTSASGFTLNVNGLGAKPCYNNLTAATRDTTIFNVAYTMLFVYDSTRVSGGCWICYRGYDSNTNTIGYQLRTNSSTLPVKFKTYRYRLYFTSSDGNYFVGANSLDSTNNTTARTPTTEKINPFGRIIYYSTNGTTNSGANLGATAIWDQYTVSIGYSFTVSLVDDKPVYVKCSPQSDGSAIIDSDTPIVQTLPSSNDGKIYILLGIAYSTTALELIPNHPVYYHDGTGIRLWSGKESYSKTETDSSFVTINSDQTITSNKTLQYGKKLYLGSAYSYIAGSSNSGSIHICAFFSTNSSFYTEFNVTSNGLTLTKHSGTSEAPVATKLVDLSYTLDADKLQMWTTLLMKGSVLEFGDTSNNSTIYFKIRPVDRTVNSQTVKDTYLDVQSDGRLNVSYGNNIKCYVDTNGVTINDSNTLTFYGTQTSYSTSLQNDSFTSTLKMTGVFAPSTTEIYTLGTSSLKWSNVYSTTFTGNLTGDVTGKFATARNINGLSFDGSADIHNYARCNTDSDVVSKEITIEGLTISDGVDIFVYFGATNTATDPTLNINNTGDIPIYFGAKKAGTTIETSWYSGEMVHFVYLSLGGGRWYAIGRSHAVFGYDTLGANIVQDYPYYMYTVRSAGAKAVNVASPTPTTAPIMLSLWSKTSDNKYFCGISEIIASTLWGVSAYGYGNTYSSVTRITSTSAVSKGGRGAVRQLVWARTGTQGAVVPGSIINDGTLRYGSFSMTSQGIPTPYSDSVSTMAVEGTWVTLSDIPSQTSSTTHFIIAVRVA